MSFVRNSSALRQLAGILMAASFLAACDSPTDVPGNGPPPAGSPSVASILVGGSNGPVAAGDTVRMQATLLSAGGDVLQGTVAWTSSDTSVATVSADGLVTTQAGGVVHIRARNGSVEGAASLYVLTATPVLEAVGPTKAVAGAGPLTLTLTGRRFAADAVVLWGGSPRPTTRVSSTELRAEIPAADLAMAGQVTIAVRNGGAFAPASGAVGFTIEPPQPVWRHYRLTGLETGQGLPVEVRRGASTLPGGVVHANTIRRVVDGLLSFEERPGHDTNYVRSVTEMIYDADTGAELGVVEWQYFGTVTYDMWDGSIIFVSGNLPGVTRARFMGNDGIVIPEDLGNGEKAWLYVKE